MHICNKHIGLNQISLFMFLLLVFTGTPAATSLGEIQKLSNQGKTREALNQVDKLLADDPNNIEGRFYKGLLLTKSNKLEQAESVFLGLIEDHPELPEPYNNLAVVYAAQGKYDKARELLGRAINTHPSYATAHENLGDIYAKMASRAYNQVLELDDNNASAREKLSLISELFSRPEPVQVAAKQAEPKPKPAPVVAKPEPIPEPKPVKSEPVPVVEKQPPEPVNEVATVSSKTSSQGESVAVVDQSPDVLAALDDWANAWSAQDVNAYLSHYSSAYIPAKGLTRARWEAQRKVRLAKPKFIKITLSNPKVTMHSDKHAEINFTQSYQSDTYSDRVNKIIVMTREDGNWLIAEERSR